MDARDVEICRRPDGTEWVLGEGRYGKVYRAVKGGVQVVAVKKLQHVDSRLKLLFVKVGKDRAHLLGGCTCVA